MPAFKKAGCIKAVPYVVKLAGKLVVVRAYFLRLLPYGKLRRFENLEYKYGVMRGERASALGNHIGLRQVVFIAGIDYCRHGVVGILLYGVVHRAFARGAAGAVVVHAQAAADVDKLYAEAKLGKLDIELRCLAKRVFDNAYLVDLAADVEVYELQTVLHVATVEYVDSLQQLAGVEAELALVAPALAPFAGTRARQFDANAHIGPHLEPLRYFGNHAQLVELLDHKVYATTHLLCQQSKLDVGFVLVAVAYDKGVFGYIGGKHCVQLRL